MDVSDISGVLERFEGRDWSVPVRGAEVVGLLELQAKLDATVARAMASFDRSSEWSEDGARSAATWVAAETRRPRTELRRWLGLGRALRFMEATGAAWSSGEISRAHVELLVPVSTGVTATAFRRDEEKLLTWARDLSFTEFRRELVFWRQLEDPDGVETDAAEQVGNRTAFLVRGFQGSWLGRLCFDAVGGTIVAGEVLRLEDELFEADWAEARERLGRDPLVSELRRTKDQRIADAFVEMAMRSASTPPDAQRPKPLITVLVDYPTLSGRILQLADGTPLAPGSTVAYLDEAMVERAVWRTPKRMEISARTRLFTGATRRAVEVRDQRCRHPYCEDIPAERCQVDHIVPAARGGPTTQDNGRMLCPFHNRLRNKPPPPKEDRRAPPDDDDVIYEDVEWWPDG
ncbi:MAG TPA: DUF222 domain-containing protein [Acidimicrobiales bacterium]|nr:DUF222 domain-containing protein [Acidimicrobiales bacterium]